VSFEHLKLFRDIAQHRSVSRGAALNDVSQSAASQHLQELERHLQVVLLDRSTRPLTITPAGRLYLDMCRDILRRKDEFDASLEQLRGQVEGTVRVASIYSVAISELQQIEVEFSKRYPQAHIEVDYLRPEKVYEVVRADEADIGLVSYPEASRDLKVIPWRDEEMRVAMSPLHPLAGKESVTAEELENLAFVGFDRELPIQREVDRFLRDHGVHVNLVLHFDNIQMVKEAVCERAGISIMPVRIMQNEIAQGRLVALPIKAEGLFRPVGIIHLKKKRFHRVAQSFLELLREHQTNGLHLAHPN